MISSGAPTILEPEAGPFRLPTIIFRLLRPLLNRNFRRSLLYQPIQFSTYFIDLGFSCRSAYIKNPSQESLKRAFGAVSARTFKYTMLGQDWSEGNEEYHRKIITPTLLIHGSADR